MFSDCISGGDSCRGDHRRCTGRHYADEWSWRSEGQCEDNRGNQEAFCYEDSNFRNLGEDEIGTPYCITVDFDTVGDEAKGIVADNCVTVRDRDTMEQVRMPISELKSYIESKIEF